MVILAIISVAAFSQFDKLKAAPAASKSSKAGTGAPAAKSEPELLLDQGVTAARFGRIQDAANVFSSIMTRFPADPASARAAIELSRLYVNCQDYASARNVMANSINALPDGPARQQVVTELNNLNGELVFSNKMGPDSIEYKVRPGDNLAKIGNKFKITGNFIRRINYLNSDRLNIGDKLKVVQGPFNVVVEKSRFRLTVYLGVQFVKEYRVGLGKENSTPEGEYIVQSKLIDPVWDPPGPEYAASRAPDNPLGPRWIGFDKQYGIHGTIHPDSIGKMESRGCVRMLNENVEEVYDLVVQGSKVIVKP